MLKVLNSDNSVVSMCGNLCINGSESSVCNSLNYIAYHYKLDKHSLDYNTFSQAIIDNFNKIDDDILVNAGLLSDCLTIIDNHNTKFSRSEIFDIMVNVGTWWII